MKIEFWLDYLCPKCYLQHQIIEELIKTYDMKDIELVCRSYEMVEAKYFDTNEPYEKFISRHKNLPVEEVKTFLDENEFNLDLFKIHDAHRLAHLAKKEKKSQLFNHLIFEEIYEKHQDLSNHQLLREIALKAELDQNLTEEILNSDLYSSQVISNRENAQLKGIYELPFMRINGKIKLQGLQSVDQIVKTLNQSFGKLKDIEFCEGENCVRKRRQ
ncbi:DsbA family oxidoreductase [Mariniplasma anaerobium]|uniref:DSBA oxidoreductase n=1 Tax=Mariniplasma anaerobium TaxID=2735436 RepID=A0A7U9XUN3_9MOLU|nr:DsbA family protein [Mariniplasma anaerobium]BCR36330.1 DSBA oxidoreductase [Mariniplasma anaerobium]